MSVISSLCSNIAKRPDLDGNINRGPHAGGIHIQGGIYTLGAAHIFGIEK